MNTPPKAIVFLITCLWCWAPLTQLKAIPLWVQFAAAGSSQSSEPVVPSIVFRAEEGGAANAVTSPVINYPDSTQVNDIMIFVLSTDAPATLSGSALPEGWTLLHAVDAPNTTLPNDGTGFVFWKRATQANPPTETWTGLFGAAQTYAYSVVSYAGCVTTESPFNASNTATSLFSSNWTISITTTVANSMVVAIFATDQNPLATFSWAVSITERADRENNITGFGNGYLTIGDSLVAVPGAKTMNGTPSNGDSYAAFAYALTPAPIP
jgi:hypothetical protein